MLVELNKSIPDNVRKKTLRWFKKDIGMTSEGLLSRMGGNHMSYWSNYLGGTRQYSKYEGYLKMAESYGVSEEQFVRKMEEFIREDLGVDSEAQEITDEVAYAALSRSHNLNPSDIEEALRIYKAYKK